MYKPKALTTESTDTHSLGSACVPLEQMCRRHEATHTDRSNIMITTVTPLQNTVS